MVKFVIFLAQDFMRYLFMKLVLRRRKRFEKTARYLAKYWQDENGT